MTLFDRIAVLGLALLATACGEWSGSPVTSVEPQPIPLGPGPTITVASDLAIAGAHAVDSWGSTVVVAWVEADQAAASVTVRAATSDDAGATFGAPVVVARFPTPAQGGPGWRGVRLGVAAPTPAGPRARPQVWVAAGHGDQARTLTWHSRDGGRTFVELQQYESPPDTVFPNDGWGHVDGSGPLAQGTLTITRGPTGPFFAVPLPEGAQGDPVVVVDEHGALALTWRERDETGAVSLVVRRAWADWNAEVRAGTVAPAFDAAYALARLNDANSGWPSAARVPGGIIVTWVDRTPEGRLSVFARRLGMDMTCTRESETAAAK